jgi:malate dehydrogenase (quinone)
MTKRIINKTEIKTNTLLIGGGIMSTTLASLLTRIYPDHSIIISERLSECGLESSDAYHNAGTGHAGYCELQYTPLINGVIETDKLIRVNSAFVKSVEFWKYLISVGSIKTDFLHNIPQYAFVYGEQDVNFLKLRHKAMKKFNQFDKIELSTDYDKIKSWIPLVMNGRLKGQAVAATKAEDGLDVDFGKLSRYLANDLISKKVNIMYNEEVFDLYQKNNKWIAIQKNLVTGEKTKIISDFVFIGAGGAAINLLKKANIPETKNYAGFPISGQWLVCDNHKLASYHNAKVYTKPKEGAPQMVAPHLDTRVVNGNKSLLFGPYAGATTKFLMNGSFTDFFKSIRFSNIGTMIDAGIRNVPLTKYLISEVLKGRDKKFELLQHYYPEADINDWKLEIAGQRVQVIKQVNGKGVVEFGTEVITNKDGSLACLLGASPGASTSIKIMLDVIEKCFGLNDDAKEKIKTMIPSYKQK